jgi:hypothetical protein
MANATSCPRVNIIPPTPAAVYTPNTISANTSQVMSAQDVSSLQTNIDTDSFQDNSIKSDHGAKGESKADASGFSSGYDAAQTPSTDTGTAPFITRRDLATHIAYQGMRNTQLPSRRERPVDPFATKVLAENSEWNENAVEKASKTCGTQ